MIVFFNGEFVDKSQATVSVDDRGFLFGDGVYEVFRATDGALFAADRHLRRLANGLADLEFTRPAALDDAALLAAARRVLQDNGLTRGDALVYLQITRGVAERRHHFPPPGTAPTVFLSASRLVVPDELRARGAAAITTADLRWERCDLKTVNLLPNVLAKEQAVAAGAFEALLVRDGIVTEGASSNLFAVIAGKLHTHPPTHRILAGITREVVLELAAELAIPVVLEPITRAALSTASEVMITATTADVMPVVSVDGSRVGDGRPGGVARRLHAGLRARMDALTARAPAGGGPARSA